MLKRIGALLLALVLVIGIVACSSNTPAPATTTSDPAKTNDPAKTSDPAKTEKPADIKPGKTEINIAIANDPGTLDICGTPSNSAWDQISYNIYDFLYTLDNNNNEVPGLAETWEIEGGQTYVFHLRKGVKFSDGTDFKAADVIASLKFYKESPSGKMPVGAIDWDNTKVIDDSTVQVAFTSPGIAKFAQVCYWRITSEAACADADKMKTNPVGTGAYMLKEWVTGTSITLVPNPNYWGDKGVIEKATYNIITDASQRTNALLAGNVDLIVQTSAKDVELIKKDGGYTVSSFSDSKCDTMLFNCSDGSVMKSADLRKAVAYATDKVGIQNAAYSGQGTTATAPVPSIFRDFDPNWKLVDNYYSYDMDKAAAALTASGVPAGTKLTIISNGGSEQMVSAQVVQASLIKLGLEAEIVTYDPAVYQKTILDKASKWDICFVSMGSPSLVVADVYLGYFLNQPYGFYAETDPAFVQAVKDANAIPELENEKKVAIDLINMEMATLPHFAYMETPIYDSFTNKLQGFQTWYTRMVPIRLLSFTA